MTTTAKTILLVTSVAIILTVFVVTLSVWLEGQQVSVDRVEYFKLYFEAFKEIWIGFLVAMLVVLIPQGIAETRYRFEKLKESRIAYSEAKTGLDYLPLRLSTLSLKDAAALIQQIHVWKHQAELYRELEQHLKRRGIELTVDQWGNMIYEKLFRIRIFLEERTHDWDVMTPRERLTHLLEIQPSVDELQATDDGLSDLPASHPTSYKPHG